MATLWGRPPPGLGQPPSNASPAAPGGSGPSCSVVARGWHWGLGSNADPLAELCGWRRPRAPWEGRPGSWEAGEGVPGGGTRKRANKGLLEPLPPG